MKNYKNPYDRVNSYYQLLNSYALMEDCFQDDSDVGITIDALSQTLDIPEKVIADDIKNIIQASEDMLIFDSDSNNALEDFINQKTGIKLLVNAGNPFIHLEDDERIALKNFMDENGKIGKNKSDLVYKECLSFFHFTSTLTDNLFLIMQAITDNNHISFVYFNREKEVNKKYTDIYPLKVLYDSEFNIYAVLALHKNERYAFRVDYIQGYVEVNYKKTRKEKSYTEEETQLMTILPYIWGFKCRDEDNIGQVKVYFLNEGQVWDKAKRYLEFRTKKKLYKKGNYLVYEDVVYGKEPFISWLLSFGSSAVLVEPKTLQNEILKIAEKCLINSDNKGE